MGFRPMARIEMGSCSGSGEAILGCGGVHANL